MCMSSEGTNTSNSVSKFEPPAFTQPGWEQYVANAQNLAGQGMPVYTGQTVAPISQQGQLGIGQLTSLATQGSPLYNTAQTNLQGTLSGDFMDPYATAANPYIGQNPYLDSMVNSSNQQIAQNFARGTAAQTDAAAAREHGYGGSGYQEAQDRNASTLGNLIGQNTNSLLGNQYNQSAQLAEQGLNRASGAVQGERGRQLQAAGLAPGYQSSDISAIQAMMGGGDQVQNWQQQLMNAGQQLFGQYQQAPWQLSDLFGGALGRASGQAGTTSTSVFGPSMSPWQGIIGGGTAAAGLLGG